MVLNAFPLDLSKYLEIAVVDVWLIRPCPENLIKKIPNASKKTLLIKEKNKEERDNKTITKSE